MSNTKNMFLKLFLISFLFFQLVSVSFSQQLTLKSASELDYPPFCIVDKDGKADGFSVELLKYTAALADMNIEFRVGPWNKIKNELKEGKLDVLPLVSFSKEREKYFDFSAPYLVLYGGVFTRNNNNSIQSVADLKNAEVIVLEGDTAHEYAVKNNVSNKIITTESYEDAFKLLAAGKHDAILVQKLVGLIICKNHKLKNIKLIGQSTNGVFKDALKPIGRELKGFEQKFCFAVPKGRHKLLAKLNEGLLISVNDGTYEKLFDKWFEFLNRSNVDIYYIVKVIIITVVIVSFILIVIALIVLKKQVKMRTSELLRSKGQLQTILDNTDAIIAMYDKDSRLIWGNKALFDYIGKKPKDSIGGKCWQLWGFGQCCKNCPVIDTIKNGISSMRELSPETQPHWPSDLGAWLIRSAPVKDRNGQITGVIEVASNVTAITDTKNKLKKANEKLKKIAFKDSLTGVLNRAPFIDSLSNRVENAKRDDSLLALLFLDLEKFKNINDTYGHQIGDKILKISADRLSSLIRKSDFIGRIGGDEFCICLTKVNSIENVKVIAQKINNAFSEKVIIDNISLDLTISIGIAIYPDDGQTPRELLKNSDIAMYKAKTTKRNSFKVFSRSFLKEEQFEKAVMNSLENEELYLVYQPIINSQGMCNYIECLLRWKNDKYGEVSPVKFLPVFAKNKAYHILGDWLLDNAFKKIKKINSVDDFKDLKLAVNFLKRQIESDNFVSLFINKIEELHVNPSNILIEINEQENAVSNKKLYNSLNCIKESYKTCQIALDDYGAGYSSFGNLIEFPYNMVKIDISLVKNISSQKYSKAVEGLIFALKTLKIDVVAEGVMTEDQFKRLEKIGCDYYQGFYFSKPVRDIYSELVENKGIYNPKS